MSSGDSLGVEQFRQLLRLQDVDGRTRAAEEEIASFGPRREEAARLEAADQTAIETARSRLAEREHRHRALEAELGVVDALVEKLDGQVYEVTSKHAMDAILGELGAARERKSGLEDQILELLDAIESDLAEVAGAESSASERVASDVAADDAMTQREAVLKSELEALRGMRAAELEELEAESVRVYESARRKAWPVMVHAETKSCPACRIVIAPQKWVEISACKRLVSCGSCHRIFYGDKVAVTS